MTAGYEPLEAKTIQITLPNGEVKNLEEVIHDILDRLATVEQEAICASNEARDAFQDLEDLLGTLRNV